MKDTFVARQPIYNRRREVVAYELKVHLGREGRSGAAVTADQLLQALGQYGLKNLVGEQLAFIQFDPEVLLEKDPFPAPPKKLVLEIDAREPLSPTIIEGLTGLRQRGYRIALDSPGPEQNLLQLVPAADVLKLDTRALSVPQLETMKSQLTHFHGQLLAHNVQTWESLAACHDLGFDYFQGFFFCRPEVMQGRKLPASRLTTMRLLSQLNAPETDIGELERIIASDVSLSYRLLRHLNSAFFGLTHKIDSIRHAVALLGLRNLRIWSSIILLAKIDDKPVELMKVALTRARMCETIASRSRLAAEDTAFMVGLLSTLEALLDTPMERILADLPLGEDITRALLRREGPLGSLLDCVIHYEQADWDAVKASTIDSGIIAGAYVPALRWAEETMNELSTP